MRGKTHDEHYVIEVLPDVWTNTYFDNLEHFEPEGDGEIYIIREKDPPSSDVLVEVHIPLGGTLVVLRFSKIVGVYGDARPWNLFKQIAERVFEEEKRSGKVPKRIIVFFDKEVTRNAPIKIVREI